MAPVLLCPECGAKHPLDGVNASAFLCEGCGRTLKVPQPAGVAANAAPAVPPAAALDPNATSVLPTTPRAGREPASLPATPVPSARPVTRGFDPVPARWVRFLLWVLAVPLAFVVVFVAAKLIGVLSSNQVEDVALDEGFSRFFPILRLLPFVALITAGLVQGGVYGLSRLRIRRHGAGTREPTGPPVDADADDWRAVNSRASTGRR